MRLTLRLALVLLAAACGAAPVHERTSQTPAVSTPHEARPARGADRRVNGVRVVHLTGAPEDMGRQMGEMCGAEIRHLIDANLKKIPWIARDPDGALATARRHAAGIPDVQMRELRATAAAAGADEEWLLVAATVIEVVQEAKACAAVAAWGEATKDGETIVGRNLDWYDIGRLHEHGLVVVRHPDAGGAFLSCGFPGLPGVLTGMNESGLFCADLVQFTKEKVPPAPGGIPVMSLQRMALERCATAEEAARLFETSPRTVAQNYVIADAKGALFLETDGAKVRRRPPVGDVVAGTNWAEEERGQLKGDLRFGNLCACIDPKNGAIGVPEIEAALGAANGGPLSVMSVVVRPATRALRVSVGGVPACKGPFADLDGAALLAEDVR